ncbi:flavodoxin domain-containing protein [Streptomyces calidiresistens]|uniref:flavodoxin domain-containing protein n=1 Tax=Streptomyces calidiresistens TaxID=1485586 RepID=UPI0015FD98BC|nr:flavodoxin domain-containing protein [Streptomyces calidiresistens]
MTVLVTAASRHGTTEAIAREIAEVLAEHGVEAVVRSPGEVEAVDPYEAVVLGSAVYAGHWLSPAGELVERCGPALAERPVWLFSSGPVGDPSRKMVREMEKDPVELPGVRETVHPRDHRMFAGRLDRADLNFPERAALLVFRGLEGDFRDHDAIRGWAASIADALGASAGGKPPAE